MLELQGPELQAINFRGDAKPIRYGQSGTPQRGEVGALGPDAVRLDRLGRVERYYEMSQSRFTLILLPMAAPIGTYFDHPSVE